MAECHNRKAAIDFMKGRLASEEENSHTAWAHFWGIRDTPCTKDTDGENQNPDTNGYYTHRQKC